MKKLLLTFLFTIILCNQPAYSAQVTHTSTQQISKVVPKIKLIAISPTQYKRVLTTRDHTGKKIIIGAVTYNTADPAAQIHFAGTITLANHCDEYALQLLTDSFKHFKALKNQQRQRPCNPGISKKVSAVQGKDSDLSSGFATLDLSSRDEKSPR